MTAAARVPEAEAEAEAEAGAGWLGALDLGFERRGEGSVLAARRHRGPLLVQRTFHPEPGVCHAYLLHPPGGVVGGDRLRLRVRAAARSGVLLTAPAAGKFYRSAGPTASQSVRLELEAGAALEWLPQENIVYDGARVESVTRVDLAGDARFLGWEITCLGRPAAGEAFTRGRLRQRLELWRGGRPLYLERLDLEAGAPFQSAAWGLRGAPVIGSLVAAGNVPGLDRRVREAAGADGPGELFSVTQLEAVLVCRYLGGSTARARRCFEAAWRVLRPALLGRPACAPRIWST
ncbi:MAG: urease accessory protein UreD [Gammaproteobacteria bacterium]|nr:urease accessory protein UreD [Gammaproteobacteria bacterium]